MNTIRISNFAELASYDNKLPNDIDWFKNNNFIIDENIPGIMLHLTGEQFHSSISTTVMKSILKLQESIYRQYSLFVYGDIRRLSTEEKGMLELYVKVENGSSIFEIIPKEINLLNLANQPLPMDPTDKVKAEIDTRLDSRFIDLRRDNVSAIFKIKKRMFRKLTKHRLVLKLYLRKLIF